MTVSDIIAAVRWCYDEEQMNSADFGNASSNDNTLMDNIIRSKIGDAVRWLCVYAPAELLGGSDEVNGNDQPIPTGILVDVDSPTVVAIGATGGGSITLPSDFLRLVRVRVDGWHRAVMTPLSEDSEEYLQLYDSNGAAATIDRPQAALIERSTKKLEVWPKGSGSTSYTYVASTSGAEIMGTGSQSDEVVGYALPPRARTAFIYYLAFLVLSAYEDSRAARMLEIAKMNIGRNG